MSKGPTIEDMADGRYMSEGLSGIVDMAESVAARRRGEPNMVEAAIRVWEQARATEDAARKAVFEAKAALALAARALDDAETREDEARREAARLMPPWVTVGVEMPFDGAEGCVVDGRFYYKVGDAIHWVKVAVATGCDPVAEDVCPDCGQEGLDYGVFNMVEGGDVEQDMTCRNCGGRWTDRFSRVERRPSLSSESPRKPTEEPDGNWKPCDMTCPECKVAGHVFSRIWESSWGAYKDIRYECRECGHAWRVGSEVT